MLHARPELREHLARDVLRRLGDEEDADTLGPDEPDRLRDLREEVLRRVAEQQVRLVEEEHELRLLGVAHLGEGVEEVGEQPHEERRVEGRLVLDARHLEQTDDALAGRVEADEVGGVDLGFAEEDVGALVGEGDELPQDHPDGGARQPAELLQFALAVVAREVGEDRAQVTQVEERQTRLIGVVEDETEAGLLRGVETEDLAQQQRAECGDGGADRDALADAAEREVLRRRGGRRPVLADAAGAVEELLVRLPRGRDAREVTFDVSGEHGDAGGRELLDEALERAGLPGSGGAGDEPVPVHDAERDADLHRGHRFPVDQCSHLERRAVHDVAVADLQHVVEAERSRADGVGAEVIGAGRGAAGVAIDRVVGRNVRPDIGWGLGGRRVTRGTGARRHRGPARRGERRCRLGRLHFGCGECRLRLGGFELGLGLGGGSLECGDLRV